MNQLKGESLQKIYQSRIVVDEVSLTVNPGEVVGLLGPNGAGKTTSFYMLVGLVSADSGTVTIDAHDVTHLPIDKRAKFGLGYLPQEASIFRKLTVEENILAILQMQPELSDGERSEQLNALIHEFKISHIRTTLGQNLSGGERRRTEIARAVAAKPKYMLLDEPFAGVDPIAIEELKQLIKRLSSRGIGILITDHNVRETLSICERAYIVSHGKMIAEGAPGAILQDTAVKQVYLGENFIW